MTFTYDKYKIIRNIVIQPELKLVFFCHANHQMRCRRRRSRRQDMFADFVHNQQVSFGICPNGVWQLCRHSYDRGWTIHFRSVWYCGSRRLRQVKTTFLSTNRCVSCLLFSSFPIILRKCQRKVGTWDLTSLPENSILTCGHANRFKRRCRYHWQIGKKQTKTNLTRARGQITKGITCCQICWVFRIDSEGFEKRIRRSNFSRSWATRAKTEKAMLFILIQLIKNNIIIIINISKKEQSLEIFAVSYTAAHHTYLPNFSVKSKQTSKKFYSLSTPPLSPGNVLPTNSNCDSYSIILSIKDENTFILVLHNCRRNFSLCWKKEKKRNNIYFFYKSKENF